jgi:VanZ family protein
MDTQQLTRIFHFLGWMAVVAIAVLTAGPGELRPHTFVPAQFERFAAYFVASSLLAFGNSEPRRVILIGVLMTLYAGVLETAQLWIPGRDAGIIDFAAKASGAWFGVLLISMLRFFTRHEKRI